MSDKTDVWQGTLSLMILKTGPLGQVFEQVRRGPIAGIGMGAGAAACYGRPGEEFTFFEIDPVVKHVALDPRFFSYLRHSAADVNVVLGDGRVSLASAPDHHYQLMILDAYSSDSIPVHLLTREALNLYLRKLAPGGLLAFHISNIHMHLRPVVANLARDAGWTCLVQEESDISDKASAEGKMSSQWAVMAEKEGDLGGLSRDSRWQRDPGDPAQRVWTDDYSSVVNVLNFGLW